MALALLHTNGPEAASAALKTVPEAQRSGDYYQAQAQVFEAAGDYDGALSAYRNAMHASPDRTEFYQQACLFLARHNRPADAVALLSGADQTVTDTPELLLLKSAMLAAAHGIDKAEEVLQQVQRRWPEWAPSYLTYGILLEGESRADLAKKQLETAISLGGANAQAYTYLARATLDATPDKTESAAQSIEKALALAPEDPLVQATAGRVYVAEHKYDVAVQHLEQAVHLQPENAQARFTLAQAYRALGRKEDAARESEEFERLRARENTGSEKPRD
jgi:cellulose synthase operon protein C